jgi:hypothetical protein
VRFTNLTGLSQPVNKLLKSFVMLVVPAPAWPAAGAAVGEQR